MKKVTAIILSLAMICCMLTACGSQQTAAPVATEAATEAATQAAAPAAASAGNSDMLVVLAPQGSSDKLAAGWYNTGTISYAMLFSKVLTLDPDNNPSCDGESLADSYTASDDFMEYEFVLKDNVKFHDGKPLTAEDVKYSIEFACRFGTLNSVVFSTFKCIEGFDALESGASQELSGITADGNKLKIKLASPTAYLVFTMGSFDILPKHILETCDPVTFATNDFWANPVGSGPYKLKEFKSNDYMILEKFDDYYGKVPEIGLVKEAFVAEGDYVTLCQAGEIDYFHTMDVATALEVEKLGTYTVKNVPIMYNDMFFWNSYGRGGNGDDPISDIRVRKAILHAIDRQAIVDSILYGYGLVHDTLVPATDPNYNADTYHFIYDPELAKSLLAEAGFDSSRTLRIATYYDNQTTANILDTIVYYLGEVGVKAEWFVLTGDLVAGIYETRDYDMLYGDNSALTPIEIYGNMSSTVGGYISKLFPTTENPMDSYIDEYRTTGDAARQAELIKIMQDKEAEMLYYMPLWTIDEFVITNNRINGTVVYGNEWRSYNRGNQSWTLK